MHPRANTLGLIFRGNSILLEEQRGRHSQGNGVYYRPIGGTIEFGERSEDALVREYKEEIGADIEIIQYMDCIENIYKVADKTGHEITLMYTVKFKNEKFYKYDTFNVTEGEKITVAKWISVDDIFDERIILYPVGLSSLIKAAVSLNK
jgi:NADH pyrophosphatase NudC (nudix superfamily)